MPTVAPAQPDRRSSETAWASATATSTRASVIGPDGSRIATRDGVTTAYLVPDPHGNIAATETASTAIANAIRYDGYGQTLGSPYVATGAITLDTKYQGRLDLSPSPAFPVYEFSARNLAPTLGTFTSLDTYAGSAQDPASMNRFLYAQANPTTLIDPTGHDACVGAECDNPTYDDRSEGLDLCVRSCQDSTTEYGPGDTGYGGSKPPKPHTTIVAGASTPPVRDTWSAATETSIATSTPAPGPLISINSAGVCIGGSVGLGVYIAGQAVNVGPFISNATDLYQLSNLGGVAGASFVPGIGVGMDATITNSGGPVQTTHVYGAAGIVGGPLVGEVHSGGSQTAVLAVSFEQVAEALKGLFGG